MQCLAVHHLSRIQSNNPAEEVCPNFHPRSTWHLMRMQRFFCLLAVKGMVDAAFVHIILNSTTHAQPIQTFPGSSKAAFDPNMG